MPDFLDVTRTEIAARLATLKPLIGEYERLQTAATVLDLIPAGSSNGAPVTSTPRRSTSAPKTTVKAPRKRGRLRGSTSQAAKPSAASKPEPTIPETAQTPPAPSPGKGRHARRARRQPGGTRAIQALGFVKAQPGITNPELVAKMKIGRTTIYRIMPALELDGKVSRKGSGWYPMGAS
jgi:hypothetical protein